MKPNYLIWLEVICLVEWTVSVHLNQPNRLIWIDWIITSDSTEVVVSKKCSVYKHSNLGKIFQSTQLTRKNADASVELCEHN